MLLFPVIMRERESPRGSQEYSVTADERQTCRQGSHRFYCSKLCICI